MKDVNIISSYAELTMDKYLELRKIVTAEGAEDVDIHVGIIAILTGLSEAEVLRMPIDTFMALNRKTEFLNVAPAKAHKRIASEYRIGDLTLVPTRDIRKITTGQYIDLKTFLKAGEDRIVEILSCMLVPKGKNYCEDYDILDVQKAIGSMSVEDAFALMAFFLTSLAKSIKDMATFLKRQARKMPKEKKAQLEMAVSNLMVLLN